MIILRTGRKPQLLKLPKLAVRVICWSGHKDQLRVGDELGAANNMCVIVIDSLNMIDMEV